MSDKTTDFIFCPFCGAVKWITDKTGAIQAHHPGGAGTLESHKCSGCKKFTYINHWALGKSPAGLDIFNKTRFSVQADIEPYRILVLYKENITQFLDLYDKKLVLQVNACVTFNWYKNEELVDRIKKYVVFS